MTTPSPSFPTIARMLAERLELPLESILPTSELEPLGVDSLTAAELLFDLEDAFHVSLGDERPTLVTVQDIADHVDRLVQATPPA